MLKDTPRAGYENDQGSETASVAGSVERLHNAWLDISADGYARLGHQTRADATFFRPDFDPSGLQSAYLGSAWLLAPTTFPDTAGFPHPCRLRPDHPSHGFRDLETTWGATEKRDKPGGSS